MSYDPAIADAICIRLVEGESLRSICRDETMPGASTVFDWLEAHEEFRSKYARARALQAEMLADEQIEIADDGTNDWMERRSQDGESSGWQENGEAIRRSALRIATRQWIASKLLPKKYGARVEIELDGKLDLTDEATRAARTAQLLAIAEARRSAGGDDSR